MGKCLGKNAEKIGSFLKISRNESRITYILFMSFIIDVHIVWNINICLFIGVGMI